MKIPAPKDDTPLPQRLASAYKELAASAAVLNTSSDELGRVIASIDKSLKRLNLGIEAWVDTESGWSENDGEYETHYVGYDRIRGEWGLALRVSRGWGEDPTRERSECWLFNDGPRELRLRAVEKLPDLLLHLKKKADKTSRKTEQTVTQARELADALKQAASEK